MLNLVTTHLPTLGFTIIHPVTSPKNRWKTFIPDSFPSNSPIITGGDFIWKSQTVAHGLNQGILCENVVSVFSYHHLKQLTKESTWEESILDLYVTNRPGLFRSVEIIPGYADHHTVVVDSDIKLRFSKKPWRTVLLVVQCCVGHPKGENYKVPASRIFYKCMLIEMPTSTIYRAFRSHVENIMKDIPAKLNKCRRDLPWVTA